MCTSPHLVIYAPTRRHCRHGEKERVGNQLGNVLLEWMFHSLDEAAMVADNKYILRQLDSTLNIIEIKGFLHDLAQHEVLVKLLAQWPYALDVTCLR